MPRLLMAGQSIELALPVLGLFHRAGFEIDYVSSSRHLKRHPHISDFLRIDTLQSLPAVLMQRMKDTQYDQVVLTDDLSLRIIKETSLSDQLKLQILPIISLDHLEHLSSKVGLSKFLQAGGIRTPTFRIIESSEDLLPLCEDLGYPSILKGDVSGGGTQTIKINDVSDVNRLLRHFDHFPAVLQEYINGELVGIEAFYSQGKLIFFNYATILSNIEGKEFTPSVMRKYCLDQHFLRHLRPELELLGMVLGVNGFANITTIVDELNQEHYFVEADLRPTVWVDHGQYFDCDDSQALIAMKMNQLNQSKDTSSDTITIGYPVRMNLLDIILNRGHAWIQFKQEPFLWKILLRNWRRAILSLINLRKFRKLLKRYWFRKRAAPL